jgi:hypothetical protein
MKRRYFLTGAACFAAAWACRAAYAGSAAVVAPDGVLQEPFGLVPLSWLLDAAGVASFVLAWLRRK